MAVPSAVDTVDLHRIRAFLCRLRNVCWRSTAWLVRPDAIHHTCGTMCSQLIDSANSVDSSMKRSSSVEVLLDRGQQIFFAICRRFAKISDPRVRQGFVRCHACCGIHSQATTNEFASCKRNTAPILERCERVIGDQDGLHFLEIRITIEWCVATKKEVRDDSNGPNVTTESR
jgi:hypothetical protein